MHTSMHTESSLIFYIEVIFSIQSYLFCWYKKLRVISNLVSKPMPHRYLMLLVRLLSYTYWILQFLPTISLLIVPACLLSLLKLVSNLHFFFIFTSQFWPEVNTLPSLQTSSFSCVTWNFMPLFSNRSSSYSNHFTALLVQLQIRPIWHLHH